MEMYDMTLTNEDKKQIMALARIGIISGIKDINELIIAVTVTKIVLDNICE